MSGCVGGWVSEWCVVGEWVVVVSEWVSEWCGVSE